jgi:hypothetical protein
MSPKKTPVQKLSKHVFVLNSNKRMGVLRGWKRAEVRFCKSYFHAVCRLPSIPHTFQITGGLIVFTFSLLSFTELVVEISPLHIEGVLMKPVKDPHDIICVGDGMNIFLQFVNKSNFH